MKMYRHRLFLSLLIPLGLVFVVGCGGRSGGSLLPEMTGSSGEVLVIARSQLKSTALGDTLRGIFEVEYPYIPQSEPSFGLTFITESAFDRLLHPYRNILWVHAHPDSVFRIRFARSRWSSGQALAYATGASYEEIAENLSSRRELLFSLFSDAERERYQGHHHKLRSEAIDRYLQGKHGMSLTVPKTFAVRSDCPRFSWLSLETRDISQGLFIHTEPLRGNDFHRDSLIARRNRFTSRHVPGPNEGTYMVVAGVVPPEVELVGDTLVRMRGFWEVQGHAMGGAFVSYSRLNASRDSVVTCEGYIYAPSKRKREYMRELEAMLGTVKLVR